MLFRSARRIESGLHAFDEYAWRLIAAGLPVLRISLHAGTLHPQFLGATFNWWRTTGETNLTMVGHEVRETTAFANNPFIRMIQHGETLRRRLDGKPPVRAALFGVG